MYNLVSTCFVAHDLLYKCSRALNKTLIVTGKTIIGTRITGSMSIGTESQTDSVYLSSSVSSLHRSKKSSSEISKTYKHASQLYLTRRLVECYEALQPVIRPLQQDSSAKENGHSTSEDESKPRAPIASASTSQRIKTWSLYATLLNAIVELGDEEGKQDFGNKLYRDIVRNVQSGEVWEQVIRDGYLGREASVDAEVVYNLYVLDQCFPYITTNDYQV